MRAEVEVEEKRAVKLTLKRRRDRWTGTGRGWGSGKCQVRKSFRGEALLPTRSSIARTRLTYTISTDDGTLASIVQVKPRLGERTE